MSEPLFTPTTARDLHRSLIEWWGSEAAQRFAYARAAFAAEQSDKPAETRVTYYTEVNPEVERRRLRAAETFLITDDMSAVCRHAALTLPAVAVEHGMLPAEIGFAVFNDRRGDHAPEVGSVVPLEVVCWYPAAFSGVAGIAVSTYMSADTLRCVRAEAAEIVRMQLRAPAMPALWTFLPYGEVVGGDPLPPEPAEEMEYEPLRDAETRWTVRMLIAAWLLMAQPIAAREHPRVARPAAKRAVRAGLLSDLTVVMLRQPLGQAGDEPSGREYHRRWIVRGHWRRIPTDEQPARVTWVHGYVKGPADQPLVMTDRVTVLAR
jgi:hypothetical protein